MKVGDLVVHIGAKPNGFRIRLITAISKKNCYDFSRLQGIKEREIIIFIDGRYDWKDQWRVFNGWKEYESR